MKVIIGMDSFKGSLSSADANQSAANGVKTVYPHAEIEAFPMADGGEGTVEALIDAMDGEAVGVDVTGPLGESVHASYGMIGQEKTAIIEIAAACGLPLLAKNQLDPAHATTYGVGEMIKHAYAAGCRKFIIGLGGSATSDGGVGMLQAMGYRFLDENDLEIGFGGAALHKIMKIEATAQVEKYKTCEFRVACDVSNVLYGESGATYVFGPQKGMDVSLLPVLDKGMKHYADVTFKEIGLKLDEIEGGGAAGGLGAAFHGYLGGVLESGIELVLDVLGVEEEIREADLVLTGEGRLDGQTAMGKVPAGIADMAGKYDVPVIGIAGSLTPDAYTLNRSGIEAVFSIQSAPVSLEKAMDSKTTAFNIEKSTEQIMRVVNITI